MASISQHAGSVPKILVHIDMIACKSPGCFLELFSPFVLVFFNYMLQSLPKNSPRAVTPPLLILTLLQAGWIHDFTRPDDVFFAIFQFFAEPMFPVLS